MKALLTLISLLITTPAFAQLVLPPVPSAVIDEAVVLRQSSEPAWLEPLGHIVIGYNVALHIIDGMLTEYGIGNGTLREGNPAMKWATDRGPLTAGILKAGLTVGSAYGQIKFHEKHPRLAFIASGAIAGTMSYVVYHNARIVQGK